jgi:threonine aldolase
MRQAGILAAAGSYALSNNIERLADDHAHAKMLSECLSAINQLNVRQETNMVFITPINGGQAELQAHLSEQGIVISAGVPSIRLVTHLDISMADIEYLIDVMVNYYR